jgi:hypothetical protein
MPPEVYPRLEAPPSLPPWSAAVGRRWLRRLHHKPQPWGKPARVGASMKAWPRHHLPNPNSYALRLQSRRPPPGRTTPASAVRDR